MFLFTIALRDHLPPPSFFRSFSLNPLSNCLFFMLTLFFVCLFHTFHFEIVFLPIVSHELQQPARLKYEPGEVEDGGGYEHETESGKPAFAFSSDGGTIVDQKGLKGVHHWNWNLPCPFSLIPELAPLVHHISPVFSPPPQHIVGILFNNPVHLHLVGPNIPISLSF